MLDALQVYLKQLQHENIVSGDNNDKIAQVLKQISAIQENSALEQEKSKYVSLY